eukprot:gene1526-1864_t
MAYKRGDAVLVKRGDRDCLSCVLASTGAKGKVNVMFEGKVMTNSKQCPVNPDQVRGLVAGDPGTEQLQGRPAAGVLEGRTAPAFIGLGGEVTFKVDPPKCGLAEPLGMSQVFKSSCGAAVARDMIMVKVEGPKVPDDQLNFGKALWEEVTPKSETAGCVVFDRTPDNQPQVYLVGSPRQLGPTLTAEQRQAAPYMAPELRQGAAITAHADTWALATLLLELRAPAARSLVPRLSASSTAAAASAAATMQELKTVALQTLQSEEYAVISQCLVLNAADRPDLDSLFADGGCLQLAFQAAKREAEEKAKKDAK